MDEMYKLIDEAKKNNISAIIASDLAVIQYAKKTGIEVHISTQCNITNIESVRFFAQYADVMVTARELNLNQLKFIIQQIEKQKITGPSGNLIEIEIFAHGALCMAISGKCYLSLDNFNYSANKGSCLQPCRRAYRVKDMDEEIELAIENKYIMSPKDLCTIGFLDKILKTGVKILKIEGRGRSPEYVKTVTRCYKEATDSYFNGTYSEKKVNEWTEELRNVYNRGFWEGYYLGKQLGEWTERYGSQARKTKVYVGKVNNFFTKINVAEIKVETNNIQLGDEYVIIGPTTGVYEDTIKEIRIDFENNNMAKKGDVCSIRTKNIVRRNDKLYKIIPVCDIDDYETEDKY
jgi:putative protease